MQIYIINGAPQAGKDTFCDFVRQIVGDEWYRNFSTVDFVKEVAAYCGWDGEKTPRNRKFLSDLKDALTEWNDVPINDIKNRIQHFIRGFEIFNVKHDDAVVFIHCREPQEIRRLCQEFNAKSVVIRRKQAEEMHTSNHADREVLEYTYDWTIDNNGTVNELKQTAEVFVEHEKLHNLKNL